MEPKEDDSFGSYKRSVREKAAESIHGLRHVLDRDPVLSPEDRRMMHPVISGSRDTVASTEHSDYSYSAAVTRLRDMLHKVSPVQQQQQQQPTTSKSVLFVPPPRLKENEGASSRESFSAPKPNEPTLTFQPRVNFRPSVDDIPSPEEMVELLRNESVRNQQLGAEKKFLSEELQNIKKRVVDVVEENRVLHEELRRSVVHELTTGGMMAAGMFMSPDLAARSPVAGKVGESGERPNRFDYEKWKLELEKINSLHVAKTSRLETQLAYAKEELQKFEEEADELRKQLRTVESWHPGDPSFAAGPYSGLCIKCGSREAILPPSVAQLHRQNIDSLTKERDDLVAHVALLKTRYEEMRVREEDMYLQMKACSEMVDQSQLEMTQALIEREQLRDELQSTKGRLEDSIEQMSQRIAEECELIRKKEQTARDDLNAKIKELLEKLAETQIALDKTSREKASIQSELEIVRTQLSTNDMDYSKATESLKVNMTQAALDRNLAVQQVERVKQDLNQAESDRHAERLRLRQEIEDLRRRLHQAEKESLTSKEECINLHNGNQALERELHLTKLSKESLQRCLSDDLNAAEKRAELRETELNAMIESLQRKHERSSGELEEYSRSQSTIIQKLRDECRLLVTKLEGVTHKYKEENQKLKSHNEHACQKLERTTARCKELQDQHSQQGLLQEKMRERLQAMDRHAQHASQQITELLAKESLLMRERRELCRHVEFLQRELMSCGDEDKLTVYLGSRGLVDGILKNVRNEEVKNKNQELGGNEEIIPDEGAENP